ncbi:MAG: ABC transporter permease, partial [Bacteroidales bacterium]
MSRVKPATAVKGRVAFKKSRPVVQNLLVVFQFTIAIVFIVCTLVIANQLNFLLSEDKGFNPSNKIVIALQTETSKNSVEVLKREFLGIPGVEMAGASSEIPGSGYTSNGYFPEGHSEPLMFHALDIDYDYLETMELEIVQGRNFSKDFGQDKEAYIINEALARQLGWDNPIGKTIQRDGKHPVIGVVNDYNFSPLHSHIEPLIITIKPWQGYSYITLKTTQPIANIKNSVEEKWEALIPSEDFSFFTLDSFISEAYNPVKEFMYMILFCSFLAIFIASLGLFGLAAFLTRKRNKEIAVRKVFGAGINRIFILVSSGFLKWVLLANGIAWPIAWFIMDNYFLANFAYNGGIKWWTFLAALLFTVFLSLFVIVFQIIRLGRLNPIDYIRYE